MMANGGTGCEGKQDLMVNGTSGVSCQNRHEWYRWYLPELWIDNNMVINATNANLVGGAFNYSIDRLNGLPWQRLLHVC